MVVASEYRDLKLLASAFQLHEQNKGADLRRDHCQAIDPVVVSSQMNVPSKSIFRSANQNNKSRRMTLGS